MSLLSVVPLLIASFFAGAWWQSRAWRKSMRPVLVRLEALHEVEAPDTAPSCSPGGVSPAHPGEQRFSDEAKR